MKRKDRNMQIDFSKTNRLIEWLKKNDIFRYYSSVCSKKSCF